MAEDARKFKFISPGVFVNEIDQSQLPDEPQAIGPLIIGSAQKGPVMKPVTVNSFSDFVSKFGDPLPGGMGGDVWRNGNKTAPTYGAYAAQAHLDSSAPLTYIRMGGLQKTGVAAAGYAGWKAGTLDSTDANGGAFGIFVWPSSSIDIPAGGGLSTPVTGALAAVLYCTSGRMMLSGSLVGKDTTPAKATAEIVVTDSGGLVNGQTFTLIDSAGLSTVYTLNSGIAPAAGGGNGGAAVVGINGIGGGAVGKAAAADAIKRAIAGTTDADYKDSVSDDTVDTVTVTQGIGGTAGNRTNTDAADGITVGNFTGGAIATVITASANQLISSDANGNLQLAISKDGTDAALQTVTFNFDENSKNFIRRVLNTDPTVTNTAITPTSVRDSNQGGNYWLGETYESALAQSGTGSLGELGRFDDGAAVLNTTYVAAVLPLENHVATTQELNDRQYGAQRASTGWFISQDTSNNNTAYVSTNMKKLFRLEALDAGESVQRDVKISISNIKYPEGDFQIYGSFSVLVRSLTDSDNRMNILERFDNLNLNPNSANYIAKVIGDKFVEYSETDKANREYGEYENRSDYIRVVVADDVAAGGVEESLIPFGVFGPVTYRPCTLVSGSGAPMEFGGSGFLSGTFGAVNAGQVATMVAGGQRYGNLGNSTVVNDQVAGTLNLAATTLANSKKISFTGSVKFPSVPLRGDSVWGSPKSLKTTFWGAWTGKSRSNTNFNRGVVDMLRNQPRGLQGNQSSNTLSIAVSGNLVDSATSPLATSWVFSLDDVVSVADGSSYYYLSGSRASGASLSAASGSYTASIDAGLDRFTAVMFGGTDGLDKTEKNAFRNALMNGKDEDSSYELFSLKAAVNMAADPENLQYNLVSIPGVTQPLVTDYLLETVEDRGDALAIIDLENIYTPASDSADSIQERKNFTVKQAVDTLKARNINNSYGAAYSPWVMIRDIFTNRTVWVPPSVVAVGALATTDRLAAPWFAPAGFTRGGLSEGAGGLPVLDVSRRLTSDNRDDLYENNINPIAKFPAEGIVIFGQKTLQQTASALDRINVRRLMLFLKREISFIASRLLFGPNVPATWANFISQAEPLLESVKAQFGVDEFRLILDESTTTPDLVDRNIIYAKLFIKPTRSAEFFAIDFIVTRSGASFED